MSFAINANIGIKQMRDILVLCVSAIAIVHKLLYPVGNRAK